MDIFKCFVNQEHAKIRRAYEKVIFADSFQNKDSNQEDNKKKSLDEELFIDEDNLTKGVEEQSRIFQAYQTALKTREFEINLFWKRALFFWGFISVSFVAYWKVFEATFGKNGFPDNGCLKIPLVFISVIIYLFCLIFHLANKGSKYWQENWESHISYLEPRVTGNLFGTLFLKDDKCFFSRVFGISKYDFSVSKLTSIVSLIMIIASYFLIVITVFMCYENFCLCAILGVVLIALLIVSLHIAHFAKGNAK